MRRSSRRIAATTATTIERRPTPTCWTNAGTWSAATQVRGVAVHQHADHERRGDERAAPAVPEHEPEHDGQERPRRHDDQEREQRPGCGFGLAEVLRPQEQHRVGGEQQRVERGEAVRLAGIAGADGSGQGILPGGSGRSGDRMIAGECRWHHRRVPAADDPAPRRTRIRALVRADRAHRPCGGGRADAPVRAGGAGRRDRRRDPSRRAGPVGLGGAGPGGGRRCAGASCAAPLAAPGGADCRASRRRPPSGG